ncbi:hypothetical protein MP638_004440 [Amoeboaphelidium occidentale]|nr:hypothetical protein MP638_004440 [Amoeboaphelidium occidentale]
MQQSAHVINLYEAAIGKLLKKLKVSSFVKEARGDKILFYLGSGQFVFVPATKDNETIDSIIPDFDHEGVLLLYDKDLYTAHDGNSAVLNFIETEESRQIQYKSVAAFFGSSSSMESNVKELEEGLEKLKSFFVVRSIEKRVLCEIHVDSDRSLFDFVQLNDDTVSTGQRNLDDDTLRRELEKLSFYFLREIKGPFLSLREEFHTNSSDHFLNWNAQSLFELHCRVMKGITKVQSNIPVFLNDYSNLNTILKRNHLMLHRLPAAYSALMVELSRRRKWYDAVREKTIQPFISTLTTLKQKEERRRKGFMDEVGAFLPQSLLQYFNAPKRRKSKTLEDLLLPEEYDTSLEKVREYEHEVSSLRRNLEQEFNTRIDSLWKVEAALNHILANANFSVEEEVQSFISTTPPATSDLTLEAYKKRIKELESLLKENGDSRRDYEKLQSDNDLLIDELRKLSQRNEYLENKLNDKNSAEKEMVDSLQLKPWVKELHKITSELSKLYKFAKSSVPDQEQQFEFDDVFPESLSRRRSDELEEKLHVLFENLNVDDILSKLSKRIDIQEKLNVVNSQSEAVSHDAHLNLENTKFDMDDVVLVENTSFRLQMSGVPISAEEHLLFHSRRDKWLSLNSSNIEYVGQVPPNAEFFIASADGITFDESESMYKCSGAIKFITFKSPEPDTLTKSFSDSHGSIATPKSNAVSALSTLLSRSNSFKASRLASKQTSSNAQLSQSGYFRGRSNSGSGSPFSAFINRSRQQSTEAPTDMRWRRNSFWFPSRSSPSTAISTPQTPIITTLGSTDQSRLRGILPFAEKSNDVNQWF